MKVIFLDIDGVLVNRESVQKPPTIIEEDKGQPFCRPLNQFDPTCVERLNSITDQTGAILVISSTWRLGREDQFNRVKAYIQQNGVKAVILDRTPALRSAWRGAEIQRWLDEHKEVDKFVIIDDDNDVAECQLPRLVQTSLEKGLQDEHIKAAVELLK